MNIIAIVLPLILSLTSPFISAEPKPECNFSNWKIYHDTELSVHKNSLAYLFTTSHMAVDADGAPNAYHPDDKGLDYLANAGYPNSSWWDSVLVPDPNNPGHALKQTTGQYVGYFISKTSLQDKSKSKFDTNRYIDATSIPYLVFPGSYLRMAGTGSLGDLGYAVNLSTNERTPFVVADVGPSKAKLGEVSIALANALGGKNANPKNGAGIPKDEILYIVFPYSSRTNKWPLSAEDLEKSVNELLRKIGGVKSVLSCMKSTL